MMIIRNVTTSVFQNSAFTPALDWKSEKMIADLSVFLLQGVLICLFYIHFF